MLTTSDRRLFRQFGHPGLGLRHPRPDRRKESRVAVYRQRRVHGEFHLHAVSVSQERWAQVRHCHEQQCGVCGGVDSSGLGAEGLAASHECQVEEERS